MPQEIDMSGLEILNPAKQTQAAIAQDTNKGALAWADALDEINTNVSGTQSVFRQKKLANLDKINAIAKKSETNKRQMDDNHLDPLHNLKVIFGDKTSQRELISRQNQLQSETNEILRVNQQDVYQYQYDLQIQKQKLADFGQRRALRAEDTRNIAAQAQTVITRLTAESNVRQSGMLQMSQEQLIAERGKILGGGNSQFFIGEIDIRLAAYAEAAASAKKTARGGITVENARKVVPSFYPIMPKDTVDHAVATGRGFIYTESTTGHTFQITPEMAVEAQHAIAIATEAQAELASKTIESTTSSTFFNQQNELLRQRYSSTMGVSLLRPGPKDADGNLTVQYDMAKFPGQTADQLAGSADIEFALAKLEAEGEAALDAMGTEGMQDQFGALTPSAQAVAKNQRQRTLLLRMQRGAQTKQVDSMVESMTATQETKEGKATIEQYARTGFVQPGTDATRVALFESSVNAFGVNAGFSGLPSGYEEMQVVTTTQLNEGLRAASGGDAILTGEDEEVDSEEMTRIALQQILLGTSKKKLLNIQTEAMGKEDQNGKNIAIDTALAVWNQKGLEHAVSLVREMFPGDLNVQEAFAGISTTSGGRTHLAQRYLTATDGLSQLFTDLHNASNEMHRRKELPETADLAEKLHTLLLDDEFYSTETMREMTTPTVASYPVALMQANYFNNNQHTAWKSGLQGAVQGYDVRNMVRPEANKVERDAATNSKYLKLLNQTPYTEHNVPDPIRFQLLTQAQQEVQRVLDAQQKVLDVHGVTDRQPKVDVGLNPLQRLERFLIPNKNQE